MSVASFPIDHRPGQLAGRVAETATVAILCAAAVVAPVCLGATGPLARCTLEVSMAIAAILWVVSARPRLSILAVPLVLAAAVSLQLLPLPDRLLLAISPVSAGAWKVAHEGMPAAFGRVSVDPSTTAMAMMRLVIAVTVVGTVADAARRASARCALITALAVCAAVVWGLGLGVPFDRSKLVLLSFIDFKGPIEAEFWRTPLVPALQTNGSGVLDTIIVAGQRYRSPAWVAADGFGPFIYSNHFASAMCMTVPALVAMWLTLTRQRMPSPVRIAFAAIVFAGAFWTVGVMATSRAGAAAMVIAGLVFLALTVQSAVARRVAWTMAAVYALALLVFAVAFYGGFTGLAQAFPESVRPRVAALLADSRAGAAQAALRMFRASPLLGIGLSCFGALVPRFVPGDMLLYYAHNDYAQLLAETGLAGLAVAIAGIVLLVGRFVAMCRTSFGTAASPMEAAAWAAVAGVAVHSAFDWNMHVPANALLACIVAGLAVATGARVPHEKPAAAAGDRASRIAGVVTQTALVATLCAAIGLVVRDAFTETAKRGLREAITEDRLASMDAKRAVAAETLAAATEAGERMAKWDPANAELALLIGQAYLHRMAIPQPLDKADAMRSMSETWLRKARICSAALSGMPEPVLGP